MILEAERARAAKEGLSDTVFAKEAQNNPAGIAAGVACSIIFPGEDPDSTDGAPASHGSTGRGAGLYHCPGTGKGWTGKAA